MLQTWLVPIPVGVCEGFRGIVLRQPAILSGSVLVLQRCPIRLRIRATDFTDETVEKGLLKPATQTHHIHTMISAYVMFPTF